MTISVRALLASLGKTVGHATLAQKVTEEKHTKQRNAGGHHEAGEDHTYNREDNLLVLRYGTCRLHLDYALMFCREQAHQRRLYHRHECHVGISRYRYGSHKIGGKLG